MKNACFSLALLALLTTAPARPQTNSAPPMILTVSMAKTEWSIHANSIRREGKRWQCYGTVRLESKRGDVLLGDYGEILEDEKKATIMPLKTGSIVRSTILPLEKEKLKPKPS